MRRSQTRIETTTKKQNKIELRRNPWKNKTENSLLLCLAPYSIESSVIFCILFVLFYASHFFSSSFSFLQEIFFCCCRVRPVLFVAWLRSHTEERSHVFLKSHFLVVVLFFYISTFFFCPSRFRIGCMWNRFSFLTLCVCVCPSS